MVCSGLVDALATPDVPPHSGDWAGNVWSAAGIPGQEQSCAQRTGFSTCEEFVRASGSAFNDACMYSGSPLCPYDD